MKPMQTLESQTLVLTETNIDTDQIIPARFLTTTTQEGLGEAAFADWRFDEKGQEHAGCALNQVNVDKCRILVAGENFGCGSSREHAIWALQQFGFEAILSSRIADIFRANALKNRLLAVEVDPDTHQWLLDNPGAVLNIDVAAGQVKLPDGSEADFELDPFARLCLLEGVDPLGYLLNCGQAIDRYERQRKEIA